MTTPIRLNLGCGDGMALEDFINVDAYPYKGVDVVAQLPDGLLQWEAGGVAEMYAGHFLEHLPPWETERFLDICELILAPGGSLTIVVPDADKARLLMESHVMSPPQYALCVAGARHDAMPHWTLWNTARLEQALERAGFAVDPSYRWQDDARVYDRNAPWQCGVRGVKR